MKLRDVTVLTSDGYFKTCSICGETKSITEFYSHPLGKFGVKSICKICEKKYNKEWSKNNRDRCNELARLSRYRTGKCLAPMSENKECSAYLGIYIAETVLSKVFNNVKIMPRNTPGYDFICGNDYKIDVKSSSKRKYGNWIGWQFAIRKNTVPDYFLCIAFDNREDLNPLHLWLFPKDLISSQSIISSTENNVKFWKDYEQDINPVIAICDNIKEENII